VRKISCRTYMNGGRGLRLLLRLVHRLWAPNFSGRVLGWANVRKKKLWYNLKQKEFRMSKCRHCGSSSYGSGCIHSPTRKHEHRDDESRCEWCGSRSYGSGCIHSPTRKHRHGPGANKCIWCGSTSNGSGCIHSPTGKHEK
jgi:hypothetical protein